MQFLKYLFLFLAAVLVAVFTFGNWKSVEISLWGGLIALVNLPFLLLVTFLTGFVPMLLFHLTVRYRLRQRLLTTERTVESLRVVVAPPEPAEPSAAI